MTGAAEATTSAARGALEVLARSGVDVLFANPGTTEIPLIKEILREDSPVRYLPTLHEGSAVSAAMGYALASGRPGVALLHSMPGVANGLSQYFNAWRSGVPLVLIAGQQDRRHQYLNPILQADMTDVMRSVSKTVWEARTAAEIPAVVAQMLVTAAAAPAGPVFLSVPVDLWEQPVAVAGLRAARRRERIGVAPSSDIVALSELIASASAPVFVAGDVVGARNCGQALAALAELVGAPAHWAPGSALANFPTTSPAHRGPIFPSGESFERTFQDADLVVLFGAELQAPILFAGVELVPVGCAVASVAETPSDPVGGVSPEIAAHGDLELTIAALTDVVRTKLAAEQRPELVERRERVLVEGPRQRERLRSRSLRSNDSAPLTGRSAVASILDAAPDGVMVVDESVSNSWVSLLGEFPDPLSYLAPARGGSLGLALGVGIGARIARPERPTLVVVGDGSLLYGIQGLWTIAHERLPVVTCVLNNSGYAILKDFLRSEHFSPELAGQPADPNSAEMAKLSIEDPAIDVVALARSFGLDAVRVADADSCRAAVASAFASGRPWLLDVVVEYKTRGA